MAEYGGDYANGGLNTDKIRATASALTKKADENKGTILKVIGVIAGVALVVTIIALIINAATSDGDSTTTDSKESESETKCDAGKELVGTECLVKCTDGKVRKGKICENPPASGTGGSGSSSTGGSGSSSTGGSVTFRPAIPLIIGGVAKSVARSEPGGGVQWDITTGSDGGLGNDIVCGLYDNIPAIKQACASNNSCVGFSVVNERPHCMKRSVINPYNTHDHTWYQINRP